MKHTNMNLETALTHHLNIVIETLTLVLEDTYNPTLERALAAATGIVTSDNKFYPSHNLWYKDISSAIVLLSFAAEKLPKHKDYFKTEKLFLFIPNLVEKIEFLNLYQFWNYDEFLCVCRSLIEDAREFGPSLHKALYPFLNDEDAELLSDGEKAFLAAEEVINIEYDIVKTYPNFITLEERLQGATY